MNDKTPGWLPADRIAELAQLIAGRLSSLGWLLGKPKTLETPWISYDFIIKCEGFL